jgi:alpha-mannosidase
LSLPNDYYSLSSFFYVHSAQGRLNNFKGGHYSSQNLSALLFTHRLDTSTPSRDPGNEGGYVKMDVWSAPGKTKPGFEEVIRVARWKEARKGLELGPSCEWELGFCGTIMCLTGAMAVAGNHGMQRRGEYL